MRGNNSPVYLDIRPGAVATSIRVQTDMAIGSFLVRLYLIVDQDVNGEPIGLEIFDYTCTQACAENKTPSRPTSQTESTSQLAHDIREGLAATVGKVPSSKTEPISCED